MKIVANMTGGFTSRPAVLEDIPSLEDLILASVHGLQADHYTQAQRDAALGPVFGVDAALIQDGTYFVVESVERDCIVGCGGWSRRQAVFGGDRNRDASEALLDPKHDPARIRAFFVHPDFARRGIGRALLLASEKALRAAGFFKAVIASTLTGVPLYQSIGYIVEGQYEVPLTSHDSSSLTLTVVSMSKTFV